MTWITAWCLHSVPSPLPSSLENDQKPGEPLQTAASLSNLTIVGGWRVWFYPASLDKQVSFWTATTHGGRVMVLRMFRCEFCTCQKNSDVHPLKRTCDMQGQFIHLCMLMMLEYDHTNVKPFTADLKHRRTHLNDLYSQGNPLGCKFTGNLLLLL